MRKSLAVLVIPCMTAFFPAAGAASASPAGETLRDAMGREVTLRMPSERIVSLAPSVTEIIFAIEAGENLVGVSRHGDYPVEAKLKPRVGDFNGPNLGKVTAAVPDVVLFTEYARPGDLEALEAGGIRSFVLPAASVGDIIDAIGFLGKLTGRRDEAAGLAAGMEAELEELGRRISEIPEKSRPLVYVEVDGPKRLYAVGKGSFMNDAVTLAGGRNVFADREEAYFAVDPGEVVRADPDVILIDYPFQYKVGAAKRAGWEKITAVREGKVYDGTDFDIILLNRPGPRIITSLKEIARLLHPGAFDESPPAR